MRFRHHRPDPIPSAEEILTAIADALAVYTGEPSKFLGHSFTYSPGDASITMHFDNPDFDIEDDSSEMFINFSLRLDV